MVVTAKPRDYSGKLSPNFLKRIGLNAGRPRASWPGMTGATGLLHRGFPESGPVRPDPPIAPTVVES